MAPSTGGRGRPPLVSIILLCHNDGRYLRRCLASLWRYTDPRTTPYEIILVNNASSDGSESFLRRAARSGRARLIENEVNRYFAGGNNQGIRIARGEMVLLLNADTLVGPGWLERLVACARRAPSIGVVGPWTNRAAGYQYAASPGYRIEDFPAFSLRWARERAGRWTEVHRLTAFCFLIKRSVVRRVGLLDERFEAGGYEDYDYCIRVRKAGYAIALADDVFVHHFGGRGYIGMDYEGLRLRNRDLLARKWCAFAFEALDEIDVLLAQAPRAAADKRSRKAATR